MGKISLENIMKSVGEAKAKTETLKFRPHEEILPLAKLNPNSCNKFAEKDTEDEIKALADDISINGLMHPIVVNKVEGIYRIISGERRFKALKMLNYENIRCSVYDGIGQAAEMRMLYAANLQARQYTAAERLQYYEQLKEILTEQKEKGDYDGPIEAGIASLMGVSDRQARKYKSISENLNAEDKEKLSKGELSVEKAYNEIKVKKEQPDGSRDERNTESASALEALKNKETASKVDKRRYLKIALQQTDTTKRITVCTYYENSPPPYTNGPNVVKNVYRNLSQIITLHEGESGMILCSDDGIMLKIGDTQVYDYDWHDVWEVIFDMIFDKSFLSDSERSNWLMQRANSLHVDNANISDNHSKIENAYTTIMQNMMNILELLKNEKDGSIVSDELTRIFGSEIHTLMRKHGYNYKL